MPTFKEKFQTAYTQAKENQAQLNNPALANTPEVKRNIRVAGLILCILSMGITFANWATYNTTGNVLIIALSANIVLPPLGLYLLITGKNPFKKIKL